MSLQQLDVLALQISILLTVFSFGLQATPADIIRILRQPAFLGRVLIAMFVVMPVLAVALATSFDLRPPVGIALVALALSPVPPLLPGKQTKAGADAAPAIGLMVVLAVISVAFVPIGVDLVGRYLGRPFTMPPSAIIRVAGLMLILPLAAGMAVRALAPEWAERLAKPAGLAGKVLLALATLVLLVAALPAVFTLIGNGTVLAMAAFVLAGLAVGHWLGGPHSDDRVLLALSTASRHPAIALAIARANFPDEPLVGAAILFYLLLGAIVAIPYLTRQRRHLAARPSTA